MESTGEVSCSTSGESSGDSDHGGAHNQLQAISKRAKRFSVQQLASLNSLYKNGMRGVGQQYGVFIEHACEDTGLTTEQVQVREKNGRGYSWNDSCNF